MDLRTILKKKIRKYYFITYEAKSRRENISQKWNHVVSISPIAVIAEQNSEARKNANSRFYDYILINSIEIIKEEYLKYKDKF